jgi:hypothetical protein
MKKHLMFSTILIAQVSMAQQPLPPSKPLPLSTKEPSASSRHLPRMLSELEGINQAWVKDYQRRTREYLLRTKKASPAKASSIPQQFARSAREVPANALSLTPVSDVIQQVPFASKNNTIELTVNNTADLTVSDISVEVTDRPLWLVFTSKSFHLGPVAGKQQKTATLTFSVDKLALVGQEQSVTVAIKSPSGQVWTKQIRIKVSPPEKFELFQNYPNPFNPTTTIDYQLPGAGSPFNVSVKVYDILGREAASLVGGQQDAGYYQTSFDARRFASGMYIYRLVATDSQNRRHVFQKKMLLVK